LRETLQICWQFISTYIYQFLQIYLNISSNGVNFSASIHRFHPVKFRVGYSLGMCGKPKFSSDSVFKNRTIHKFDIRSDGFPIETACNLLFK